MLQDSGAIIFQRVGDILVEAAQYVFLMYFLISHSVEFARKLWTGVSNDDLHRGVYQIPVARHVCLFHSRMQHCESGVKNIKLDVVTCAVRL